MVKEISKSKSEDLKTMQLDVLHDLSVNEFIDRQNAITKLKQRVSEVGSMPLGRIFKAETRMWSWFEDFLLIKLLLRHGYSNLNDVIDDQIWQLCTPRLLTDHNGCPSFIEVFQHVSVSEVIDKLMFTNHHSLKVYITKDSTTFKSLSKKCFGVSYNARLKQIA